MRLSLLRKYWKTAELEATGHMGDDPMFFVQYIFRFLRVVALLSVWRMILENQPQNAEMSLAAVLTYTLIGRWCTKQERSSADRVSWRYAYYQQTTSPAPQASIPDSQLVRLRPRAGPTRFADAGDWRGRSKGAFSTKRATGHPYESDYD